MGEIKLDHNVWSIDIISYSSAIDGLAEVSKPSINYTDLQPFLKVNSMVDDLNGSLKKFKSCTVDQTKNMTSAAGNKVNDDAAGAKGFTGGR